MPVNRGKQFEQIVRNSFGDVPHTLVVRLPDQTNGYAGGANMCDFIVYHYPRVYCLECKTIHGNTLPFSNISKNQWLGLLEADKKKGVVAGIICWWVDRNVTKFIPISVLKGIQETGKYKSFSYAWEDTANGIITLQGKKKRVFFEYDMEAFFEEVERSKL